MAELTNEKFFKKCYDSYFRNVVAFVNYYLHDVEGAKNVAQDTFVSFWENIEKIDRNRSALPYLLFISKNKAFNALDKEISKKKYTDYIQKSEVEIDCMALGSSNLDAVLKKEIETIISDSMSGMSKDIKNTFYLSRFEGLKNREIAERVGVSIKTVEYRISSALRVLRKAFEEYRIIVVLLGCLSLWLFNNNI